MSEFSPCPKCACVYTYELGEMLACPECAHEWSAVADTRDDDSSAAINEDHDIDCRVDGFGAMYLKSSVVQKV